MIFIIILFSCSVSRTYQVLLSFTLRLFTFEIRFSSIQGNFYGEEKQKKKNAQQNYYFKKAIKFRVVFYPLFHSRSIGAFCLNKLFDNTKMSKFTKKIKKIIIISSRTANIVYMNGVWKHWQSNYLILWLESRHICTWKPIIHIHLFFLFYFLHSVRCKTVNSRFSPNENVCYILHKYRMRWCGHINFDIDCLLRID